MKKSLFLCLLLSIASILFAEELKFVTVLSSPVGSFNKLETVDSATPAKSPTINFCTSIGLGGTVALKGASKPDMETMNLSQSTVLGRAGTGDYVLNKITMKNGGSLKGSRLLANTVQVNYKTAGKSDKLYTDTLTVAGAKANDLYVGGDKAVIKLSENAGVTDPGMMWSNEYKTDKACGDDCKNQYLLKQKGGTSGIIGGGLKPDPDIPTPSERYECIVEYQWKPVKLDRACPALAGGMADWQLRGKLWDGMECGNKHYSGSLYFLPSDPNIGEWYIYKDVYECVCGYKPYPSVGYGYYCVRWGTVDNKSKCKTPPSHGGNPCSFKGSSEGGITGPIVNPGGEYTGDL